MKKKLELSVENLPTEQQFQKELNRINYKKEFRRVLYSTISSLLVVASIAVLISTLFLPVLRVTGTSMSPTLINDELVMCSKRSNFKSGDVVAFYFNNKILLKRVIGVAGDIIDIKEDGTVLVNDVPLDEPYIQEKAYGECDLEFPYQVPDNRIFVLGDNRAVSVDSRSSTVGCIADEFIIGKLIVRVWPLKEFTVF
jgi:signal peptidase I